MVISQQLLDILVCPEDRTPLTLADDSLLDRLNRAITAGKIKNRSDETLDQRVEAALVRLDGKQLYLIIDDIPNLLADRAVDLFTDQRIQRRTDGQWQAMAESEIGQHQADESVDGPDVETPMEEGDLHGLFCRVHRLRRTGWR